MENVERAFPISTGDEVQVVGGWLDWQRATIRRKCAGLSESAGRSKALTASAMTITSLVWHLAWVEEHWFEISFMGADRAPDPDCGWTKDGTLSGALAAYTLACEKSRSIVADHSMTDLERYAPPGLPTVSLRWIVSHVLEETARHLGHLDLMREAVDGERGY